MLPLKKMLSLAALMMILAGPIFGQEQQEQSKPCCPENEQIKPIKLPCICRQWRWATWSSNGTTYYSYYSKYCTGTSEEWVSYDTTDGSGDDYPGEDCTMSGCMGCTDAKAIKIKRVGKDGQERTGSGSSDDLRRNGLNKPFRRNALLDVSADGGIELVGDRFFAIVLLDNLGNQKIHVMLHKFELTPADNMSGHLPGGATDVTLGIGQQVAADDADTIVIPWSSVTPIRPTGDGPTKCIKFEYDGTEYQVITRRAIP